MELETSSSLPHAHQQIRLGDIQASAHKWSIAIDYYIRAIEYFNTIQNTLDDHSLISIIQAQIVQCEKTIHLCRLKDRSELQAAAVKARQEEYLLKRTRAYSTSNLKSSINSNRIISKHNTLQTNNHDDDDSFSAFIFSKPNNMNETSPIRTQIIAKKNKKHDSHKIEELQMSYEALKTHLKVAFDDIERLKYENNQLRIQKERNITYEQNDSRLLTNSDEEDSETELAATL